MSFDKIASKWDSDRRIKRANVISQEIKKYLDLGSSQFDTALEFGCGTGLISFNLHDLFKKVMMIDVSEGMIEVLNSKIEESKVNNMHSMLADLHELNKIEETYDIIYSSMVLHHIPEYKKALKTIRRLLNEDGYLCIVDFNALDQAFHKSESKFDGHHGFEVPTLEKTLRELGYKDIESKTFYHGYKKTDEKNVEYSLFILKAKL